MVNKIVYTVGGTVQAGGGVYIKRRADDELLNLCKKGEWASILSSRQIGKSSLMVKTAQELEKDSFLSAIVDLSAIGVSVSQEQWYLGILTEIVTGLDISINIHEWWENIAYLGPTQKLTLFFRDIVLKEIKQKVVIFFDEIDSILSMSFSRDDFFAGLRAIYNLRATNDEFSRLSIVLVGVATPNDLITDNKRTPYNIGRQVELSDFTLDEIKPLSTGLGINGEEALSYIYEWTNGHPYLTQLLCSYIAKTGDAFTRDAVKNAVNLLFKGEQGRQDNNLRFVKDMLIKRAPDTSQILKIYQAIRAGKPVKDDEHSTTKSHLKISGLVQRKAGLLIVRNKIYEDVFDLKWVKENTPTSARKRTLLTVLITIASVVTILGVNGQFNNLIYRPIPMTWVEIPAGEFSMGSHYNPDEEPIHNVQISTFEISQAEITNRQYVQCVKASICAAPINPNYLLAEFSDHPVTNISWINANQFCEWINGRLPTEAEWEKAAKGNTNRLYPWGNTLNNGYANFNQNVSSTTPVGFYKRGASPDGVFDLAGNASEWVADFYDPDYYSKSPKLDPKGPDLGQFRVIRGGSWNDDENLIRTTSRIALDPLSSFPTIGFRCARDK